MVQLEHEGFISLQALLVEPAMVRTVSNFIALVTVVWKHNIPSDEVILGETAIIEKGEWPVLMRPSECAPESFRDGQPGAFLIIQGG